MNKNDLPEEIVNNIPKKTVASIFFLVLFIVFLLNAAAFFYLQFNTPNLGYEINTKKWKIIETLDEKKDWLILGDSTCNQGISVSAFNENLETTSLNLCTLGDMLTTDDSWLLETYIKKFGPPRHILIIHAYDIWHKNEMSLPMASQLPIWNLIKNKPAPWNLDTNEELALILYKYFPLYSQKDSLRDITTGLFKKRTENDFFDREFDKNGFMAMKNSNARSVALSLNSHGIFVKNNTFKISPNNLTGLENINKLSIEYGFDIFIANSPINDKLYENVNFQNYVFDMKKFFLQYANENNWRYMDKIYTFPSEKMVSSDHIIAEAALEYTKKISDDIKNIAKMKN